MGRDLRGRVARAQARWAWPENDRGWEKRTGLSAATRNREMGMADQQADKGNERSACTLPVGEFLYQFHDGEKIEQAQQELADGRVSYIPEENAAVRALGEVNHDVVPGTGAALPGAEDRHLGRGRDDYREREAKLTYV